MSKKGQLTGKQQRAIEYLLTMNVTDAAAAVGVARRTMGYWLALPHFQEALRRAQSDVASGAVRKLGGVVDQAIDRLLKLLDADKPEVQLGACRAALSAFPDLRRLTDLDERLAELERRLGNV